uniref:Lysocardiolipin acyltransferase 1 n=1 Tax=Phallusia mammillata TaxID=59560 RepID=A0A6F9DK40_9ASCI|nr:lysocardiolipin acyltransferase 1 [Phallusia mammillata]
MASLFGYIRGTSTILSLMVSCIFGTVFIYGPIWPIMFLWPWLYRRVVEVLAAMWQTLIVITCEKLLGIQVVVTGDAIDRHDKTVILMNHRTRLDWLYFLCYVFHAKILNRHKIALKSALKWVPGVGWAMQVAAYIFLDRNWEIDQNHINRILRYFVELDSKHNILFFPEGTDLSKDNLRKSKEFAKKSDLTPFDYVLQPRRKGFTHFVNTLRNISGIQAVHDVTVAYPFNIPQEEVDLLKGDFPREVHFHIRRYPIEELPKDEKQLGDWCQDRWAEKEELLCQYYATEPKARKFQSQKIPPFHPRTFLLWFALFVWASHAVLSAYAVIVSPFFRWYMVIIVLSYLMQGLVFGGAEKVELFVYDQLRKPWEEWGKAVNTGGAGDASSSRKNPYDKYLR